MQQETTIRILLLPVIFLTVLPSILFSQSLNTNQKTKGEFYKPDPFADYMLSTDNPCNTDIYLELKNKSRDEMSEQESVLFKQQSQKCRDYVTAIEDSKPDKSVKVSSEDPNPLRPYFIIGACATVIAVGIVIIV